mmetsp:Transcript_19307/g.27837  ORF Transcript_19307/g.27837 Transcript_19307/m.27837 type:complete len:208 (-) Transcript_19307:1043-1666(-)
MNAISIAALSIFMNTSSVSPVFYCSAVALSTELGLIRLNVAIIIVACTPIIVATVTTRPSTIVALSAGSVVNVTSASITTSRVHVTGSTIIATTILTLSTSLIVVVDMTSSSIIAASIVVYSVSSSVLRVNVTSSAVSAGVISPTIVSTIVVVVIATPASIYISITPNTMHPIPFLLGRKWFFWLKSGAHFLWHIRDQTGRCVVFLE